MAAISTLGGDFSSAQWAKGDASFTNAVDNTRLDLTTVSTTSFTDTGTPAGYDLTGSSMTFKMGIVPENGQMSVEWRVGSGAGTGWRILRSSSAHTWQFQTGATITGSTWTDAYMRAHPWVRIRESGGTVFLELSANGISGWAEPDGTQHATVGATVITAIEPRFQTANLTAAVGWHWSIEQVNGTAAPAGGTWADIVANSLLAANTWTATTANINATDASFATNTGSVQNTIYPMDVQFDTSSIPAGATINSARLVAVAKPGSASRSSLKVEGFDGATSLGASAMTAMTLTSDNSYTAALTATAAQLRSANFKATISHQRTASQANTVSLNSVVLQVDYVPAAAATLVQNINVYNRARRIRASNW